MAFIIFIAILIFIAVYCYQNKLFVELNTFFKKGFFKKNNKFGLYLYTGKQGTGKTYSAIKFLEKIRNKQECITLTNVKSYSKSNIDIEYISDIFRIIGKVEQLEKNGNNKQIIIFFDEIFTVCEKSGSLTPQILSFLSQLRKRNIIFVSTAQEWSEINITFRRYCRFQISCNMVSIPFINQALLVNRINDGDGICWNNELQEFIAPLLQTNISKGLKNIIDLYDTYETISLTSTINKTRSR